MKTNKLPKSAWSDSQEAGSQSQQTNQSSSYYLKDNKRSQTSSASNDSSYNHASSNDEYPNHPIIPEAVQDNYFGYKSAKNSPMKSQDTEITDSRNTKSSSAHYVANEHLDIATDVSTYVSSEGTARALSAKEPMMSEFLDKQMDTLAHDIGQDDSSSLPTTDSSYKDIPERIFMNGLIKHTGIALAIIIPLAAFSAYAATPPMNTTSKAGVTSNVAADKTTTETLSIKPSAIIHKSATTPTTVDSVDLKKYAGTWYEIGRLPMYFQRKCAGDVTANYTEKADGTGIVVTNKCVGEDGSGISAEGLAKPADETGSKLKVTFLPSWIRWLPVGRADYWVLARDADYKTALVGTPDKDYLWLLARSPNISQETYAKYRQIAQQQGYNLKEFKLTPQTNQTVRLVP